MFTKLSQVDAVVKILQIHACIHTCLHVNLITPELFAAVEI